MNLSNIKKTTVITNDCGHLSTITTNGIISLPEVTDELVYANIDGITPNKHSMEILHNGVIITSYRDNIVTTTTTVIYIEKQQFAVQA